MNKGIQAKAQQGIDVFAYKHLCNYTNYYTILVSVPKGLKSTGWSTKLSFSLTNQRSESIQFHWVDYGGNPVLYGQVSPGASIKQLTFGTHPWLITTTGGEVITYFVPLLSNLQITVE